MHATPCLTREEVLRMRKKKGQESVVSIATASKEYDAATEKDNNIVGKRIAEARKKKGLSIAAFGKLLG